MKNITRVLSIFAIAIGVTQRAWSFDFVPTQAEWMAWPEFCKASYVRNPGVSPAFVAQVDQAMIQRAQAQLGTCFAPVHHYCAGLHKLNRALEKQGNERDFGLHQTEAEFHYVRSYCPSSNPFWADNETKLAITKAARGRVVEALSVLDGVQAEHPGYAGSYIVRAKLLSQAGRKDEVRRVLLDGEKATGGKSAELQYALGLSFFSAKEFEEARVRARQAYSLGYPLPWLRENLARAGYPL